MGLSKVMGACHSSGAATDNYDMHCQINVSM